MIKEVAQETVDYEQGLTQDGEAIGGDMIDAEISQIVSETLKEFQH